MSTTGPVYLLALHAINGADSAEKLEDIRDLIELVWELADDDDFENADVESCKEEIEQRRKELRAVRA